MQFPERGKILTQAEYDSIPSYIEVLKMMGLNIGLYMAGSFKTSYWMDGIYYEFYSPSWYKHHGKADAQPSTEPTE